MGSVFDRVDLFADGVGRFNVWRGSKLEMGEAARRQVVERTHAYYKMLRRALAGGKTPKKRKAMEPASNTKTGGKEERRKSKKRKNSPNRAGASRG